MDQIILSWKFETLFLQKLGATTLGWRKCYASPKDSSPSNITLVQSGKEREKDSTSVHQTDVLAPETLTGSSTPQEALRCPGRAQDASSAHASRTKAVSTPEAREAITHRAQK